MKSKEDAKPGDRVRMTKVKSASKVLSVGAECVLARRLGCGCWAAKLGPSAVTETVIGPSAGCKHPQGSLSGYPVGTELDWAFVEATPPV